ncbi:MAG: hypothetical protein AAF747_08085 [Planctomycetota bacterium]
MPLIFPPIPPTVLFVDAADGTLQPAVRSSDQPPGASANAGYAFGFGDLFAATSDGFVAFSAETTVSSKQPGVYAGMPGDIRRIAGVGDSVQTALGQVELTGAGGPLLNERREIVFTASFNSGGTQFGTGAFRYDAVTGIEAILVAGEPAPGLLDGTIVTRASIALDHNRAFSDGGFALIEASVQRPDRDDTDQALYLARGTDLTLIAAENWAIPGRSLRTVPEFFGFRPFLGVDSQGRGAFFASVVVADLFIRIPDALFVFDAQGRVELALTDTDFIDIGDTAPDIRQVAAADADDIAFGEGELIITTRSAGDTIVFRVPLELPCLADQDRDGDLDIDDFSAFLVNFFSFNPTADINLDGFFDVDDFSGFVAELFDPSCDQG